MNTPSLTRSNTGEDPENFTEELKKVYEAMHVFDAERFELATYQLKSVARIWFDQLKDGRAEDAPYPSWSFFEKAFLGNFFLREVKESKVREFLTLKKDSMSVHGYGLKFTHLSPMLLRW